MLYIAVCIVFIIPMQEDYIDVFCLIGGMTGNGFGHQAKETFQGFPYLRIDSRRGLWTWLNVR